MSLVFKYSCFFLCFEICCLNIQILVLISWHINERCSVFFVSFEKFFFDENVNLILDHLWVWFKHLNLFNYVVLEMNKLVAFMGLHDFYDLSLDLVLASFDHASHCFLLFFCWQNCFLFVALCWHHLISDLVRNELQVHFDVLRLLKYWSLWLVFEQELSFWIAHRSH